MSIKRVITPAVPESPAFSNCFVVDGMAYISGQHGGDPKGGLLGDGSPLTQARETFRKIQAILEAAGGGLDDVVKLTVYVTDMAHRPAVGQARKEMFREPLPASTLIAVAGFVDAGLVLEIDAIAAIGRGGRPAVHSG